MSNYSNKVMSELNRNIQLLAEGKACHQIVRDDKTDFTRARKLPFTKMIKTLLFMSSKSIQEELYEFSDYDSETATSSAFVQARDKILPEALKQLFEMMNSSFQCRSKYKGYRLLAVDGSQLPIPFDCNDSDTYKSNGNHTPTSLFHISSMYDLLERRYIDMNVNGIKKMNEQGDMVQMVQRYEGHNAIFIADRNYATWNIMAHVGKANQKFLIRSKDIKSQSSLIRKFKFPNEEFDKDVETIITNVNDKEVNANPDTYRKVSTTTTFDFLDKTTRYYPIKLRVVRFRINGEETYESIVTNLPREEFPVEVIKELYGMRWDIEVSFRHLKYASGLQALNSKKRNNILQEIWARTILYNISMIITKKLSVKKCKKQKKWEYKINLTKVIHFIRNLAKRKGGLPPNFEAIVLKELIPIRPGRHHPRKIMKPGYISTNYRFT